MSEQADKWEQLEKRLAELPDDPKGEEQGEILGQLDYLEWEQALIWWGERRA